MLQLLKRWAQRARHGRQTTSGQVHWRKPALEALEQRDVPSLASYAPADGFNAKDFYIDQGNLYERDTLGQSTLLTPDAVSVSAFTDTTSAASADVILNNGALLTWNDASGWQLLNEGVAQAYAGTNGNSAVLFQNGDLYLYTAGSNSWVALAHEAVSASIGTDLNGSPMVAMVLTNGLGFEWRAAGGYEFLGVGVAQMSAGESGMTAILYSNGYAYNHYDTAYTSTGAYSSAGSWLLIAPGGVASVSAGTDAYGSAMTSVTTTAGLAFEWGTHTGWKYLGANASEVDAGLGGITYYVTPAASGTGNDIFQYNDMGGAASGDNVETILNNNAS